MNTGRHKSMAVPPWGLGLVSMFTVQLGSALSVHMIPRVGPAGIAWLRLTIGALIFVALTRPPPRTLRRGDWPAILGLGAATGLLTVAFLAAIARIPLGTTVSIEFLGPLTAAALRSPNKRAAGWLSWPCSASCCSTNPGTAIST
jgi:inner membrane transporter RhtA